MILFARPQDHARRQVQGLIGVSPVSRFSLRTTIKAARPILPAEVFADSSRHSRDVGRGDVGRAGVLSSPHLLMITT
jgi:hypothetical protein